VKKSLKLETIKSHKAFLGTKPHKTSSVLQTSHYCVIRQAVIIPVMPEIIGFAVCQNR